MLVYLQRHRMRAWIAAVLYGVLVTFPHEQVQDIVNAFAKAMGRTHFFMMMALLGVTGGAAFAAFCYRKLRHNPSRATLLKYALLTLALIAGTWGLLTFNNTELVHYPQYVPMGFLLMALTGSPAEALCFVVLCGGLDECYQYWGIHGAWGVPFDFNDVYMDLLGGALGVILCLVLWSEPAMIAKGFWKSLLRRPGVFFIVMLVLVATALWAVGLMQLNENKDIPHWFALNRQEPHGFWFHNDTWGPHTTHILTPVEGPALILATLALFALLGRRVRIPV